MVDDRRSLSRERFLTSRRKSENRHIGMKSVSVDSALSAHNYSSVCAEMEFDS